jgi:hypothetical protein
MPCEQVHWRDARSMSCWQNIWVVTVKIFHSAFQVLPNSKLGWLSSWYKFIINNPSNTKKISNIVLTLDLDWQNFLVVGNWQSSIVHFAASFKCCIGRPMFHHLWWHGPKYHLASPKGLGKFKLWHSCSGTPKHTQTVIDATQKEIAIDQQQQ